MSTGEIVSKRSVSAKTLRFPRDENKRRFNIHWYDRFCWLEYSVKRDAAFCFACRKFGRRVDHTKETTFTISGFKGWKRAVGDQKKVWRCMILVPLIFVLWKIGTNMNCDYPLMQLMALWFHQKWQRIISITFEAPLK